MAYDTTRILRTRLAAAGLCALLAGAAGAVDTPAAPAAGPAAAPAPITGEALAVKKLIEQRFPTAVVRGVVKTPYFGLYEIQLDDQLLYTDTKVNYVMAGSVYDANTKQNLTEAKLRKLNRVAFDTLPLDLAFKRVKGNGQRKMAIFSDADCPFCAKLEDELKAVDNVTIYTFLFPIDALHPDSARKSRMIWCSSDRVKSWDEFFASGSAAREQGRVRQSGGGDQRARQEAARAGDADAGVRGRQRRPRRASRPRSWKPSWPTPRRRPHKPAEPAASRRRRRNSGPHRRAESRRKEADDGDHRFPEETVHRHHRVDGRLARHAVVPLPRRGQGNQERRAAHRARIAGRAVRLPRPVRRHVRSRQVFAHDRQHPDPVRPQGLEIRLREPVQGGRLLRHHAPVHRQQVGHRESR